MLRRIPNETVSAFVARSYLHEARSARGQMVQLIVTPFVLMHLAVFVGLGLMVGAALGVVTHNLPLKLGQGIAAGISLGLISALVGCSTVAIADRGRRQQRG